MSHKRSNSSSSENVLQKKDGRGRPRKNWEELNWRSQYRRLECEEEEWLLNLGEAEQFDEGSSLEGLCQSNSELRDEEVGATVAQQEQFGGHFCSGETDVGSLDGLNFQWEEHFDRSRVSDVGGVTAAESMSLLTLTFDELMAVEEPLSEDEDDDDFFDYNAAVTSSQSSSNKLQEKLAIWRSKHNITRTAMTELLHILCDHQPVEDFSSLPRDARTITKHTSFVNTEGFQTVDPCAGGIYVHLGIADQSTIILNQVDDQYEEVIYEVSTDGLPLWKSSLDHIWPWMVKIVSVPSVKNLVFLVGAWFGKITKPTSGNAFMVKFVEELSMLLDNGIIINDRHREVFLRCIIADAPARCLILESVYFNGYGSCPKCKVHGSWDGRTFFPLCQCATALQRSHQDYVVIVDRIYHKAETILTELPGVDLVEKVPFDPMHLVYRGVTKTLLSLWVAGERPYKLSVELCNLISTHLVECRSLVPSDFQRKPRALLQLAFFKATEYRLFILYIGPVCVKRELDYPRYINFLCLHVAVRILADPNLCRQEQFLVYAEKLLLKFLQHFCDLYDEKFLTHNFHGLYPQHIVNDVRTFGSFESFSSFLYDNFLGHLKKKIRKGDQALQQLVNRYIEDSILAVKQISVSSSPDFNGRHETGPLLSYCSDPQYRSVLFKNFKISITAEAESFCFLKRKEIVCVVNICFCRTSKRMVLVGRKFIEPQDFFDVPCKSSLINIFRVSKQRVSSLKTWALSDVVCKMIAVPYESDFVMYPLLHCEV